MILIFPVIISERANVHFEYDKTQKIILHAKRNLKKKNELNQDDKRTQKLLNSLVWHYNGDFLI